MSERVWSSAAITTENIYILSSKRWCRSVGTRIIRLHRGYSPHNASCNLPRLWPGDTELLFVLYHLFSKHIKGKAEINPRAPQQSKDKRTVHNFYYTTCKICKYLVKSRHTDQTMTNYIILTRNCFRSRISFFNLVISRNNSLFSRNIFKLLDLFCCSTWLSWLLRERTVFSR